MTQRNSKGQFVKKDASIYRPGLKGITVEAFLKLQVNPFQGGYGPMRGTINDCACNPGIAVISKHEYMADAWDAMEDDACEDASAFYKAWALYHIINSESLVTKVKEVGDALWLARSFKHRHEIVDAAFPNPFK